MESATSSSPPCSANTELSNKEADNSTDTIDASFQEQSGRAEDGDSDSRHGFLNATTNITVIEVQTEAGDVVDATDKKHICEGSDSGVEVVDTAEYHRALSSNSGVSQDCDNACARSRDSSISYCSNYEEAYNILVRKNSTLLEDYTLRNGDVTSENGSESSSLSGSQSRCRRNNLVTVKKKTTATSERKKDVCSVVKERSRCKPPITPARNAINSATRLKSIDRFLRISEFWLLY